MADLLDAVRLMVVTTARSRQAGRVRRFTPAWLVEGGGQIDDDPLLGLKAPKLDTKVTEVADRRRIAPADQSVCVVKQFPRLSRQEADCAVDGRDRDAQPASRVLG